MSDRNKKEDMRKEYENIAKHYCKVANFKSASQEEKDGMIGIACVLAFMRGEEPIADRLAANVGLDLEEIQTVYNRLLVNGLFSNRLNIKNDPVLVGTTTDIEVPFGSSKYSFKSFEQTRNAWCLIAGIASNVTGLRDN